MKRLCATLLMIAWGLSALAGGKSTTIVYINGAKYYIHTVQAGETLYGLSKTYGVGEQVIVENNPSIVRGLKTNQNIKIPYVAEAPEIMSERKLRKTFNFHQVAPGETLFVLSRQYEIPVKTLMADNPNLDPLHMRPGERVLIRRKQIGSETAAGTQQQWEAYQKSLNSVAETGTSYHIVHAGEHVLHVVAHHVRVALRHRMAGKIQSLRVHLHYLFRTHGGGILHFRLLYFPFHAGNVGRRIRNHLFLHFGKVETLKSRNIPVQCLGLFHCGLDSVLTGFCHFFRTHRVVCFF